MKTGDTKYYRVKQIKKAGRVAGYLIIIGRQYGYIVQLHYFNAPGYKVEEEFSSLDQAERRFDDILSEEGQ